MALLDMIARGNTDIPGVVESYQAGLKQMREGKAAEQTAELRGLQIGQAKKEASTWEADKARQVKAEETQQKQIEQAMEQDKQKYKDYTDDRQKTQHIYNLKETDRFIDAATAKGADLVGYVTENADAIKEAGGDHIDQIVDTIISGKMSPDQVKKLRHQLRSQSRNRQTQLRDLEKIAYEYGLKNADPAADATAAVMAKLSSYGNATAGTPEYEVILNRRMAEASNFADAGAMKVTREEMTAYGEYQKDQGAAALAAQQAASGSKLNAPPSKADLDMAMSYVSQHLVDPASGLKFWDSDLNPDQIISKGTAFAYAIKDIQRAHFATTGEQMPQAQAMEQAAKQLKNRKLLGTEPGATPTPTNDSSVLDISDE